MENLNFIINHRLGKRNVLRAVKAIAATVILVTLFSLYFRDTDAVNEGTISNVIPESGNETISEPFSEPISEPFDEPLDEPFDEPLDEPISEPISESVSEPDPDLKYTMALDNSPFKYISEKREEVIKRHLEGVPSTGKPPNEEKMKEDYVLINWDNNRKVTKLDQCKVLVSAIYLDDQDWSNDKNTEPFGEEATGNPLLSLLAERLRIYDYCFITGKITIREVIGDGDDAQKFIHKMFPFLKQVIGEELLLPKITDLTSLEVLPPMNPIVSSTEHNENFWQSWVQMSRGKGLITTFSEDKFSDYFFRQLKVLSYLRNDLPIQIVVKDDEFSEQFIKELSEMAKSTNQKLYLVNYSSMLDEHSMRYLGGYINKFLATLFNTFEEFVLMDADATPFFPLETYLETPEYTATGSYFFSDRDLDTTCDDQCIQGVAHLEPSREEAKLIKTSVLFTTSIPVDDTTMEGRIYNRLMKSHYEHNLETGLVVIDKKNRLNGLLMSIMLNLNDKLSNCFLGDKEFFWLGQLYAGLNYTVEPLGAALAGFPIKIYEDNKYRRTELCDPHIAHVHNNRLFWSNGGLRAFKASDAIDYTNIRNPRMEINGVLLPDAKHDGWRAEGREFGETRCSSAVEIGSIEEPYGQVIWFDQDEFRKVDDISRIWNH